MTLLTWARDWFDDATVANFLEPLVADWQSDAIQPRSPIKRIVSHLRWRLALIVTVLRLSPRVIFSSLPGNVILRAARRMTAFCLFGVALSLFLSKGLTRNVPDLALLLIPSALTIVIAFAPLVMVEYARRESGLRRREQRRLVMQFAILASLWVVIGGGWLTPIANQAFREQQFREYAGAEWLQSHSRYSPVPRRGPRELTTAELFTATRDDYSPDSIEREIHNRFSLMVLPAALAILRWVTLNVRAQRSGFRWTSVLVWPTALLLFSGLRYVGRVNERFYDFPTGTEAWAPPVVMLLVAILIQSLLARRARPTPLTEGAIG